MRLILCVVCVTLVSSIFADISFEKPRYPVLPWQLPKVFQSRFQDHDPQSYPLAIEAVLSVALKLQAIEDRGGKQENFLVSPLAVAGALGQLMLGARGELRKQIAVLLTLRNENLNRNPSTVTIGERFGNTNSGNITEQRMSNPTNQTSVKGSGDVVSRVGNTVSAQNAWAYESQSVKLHHFSAKSRDGLPGLELHRQLGRLINDLSTPLPESGVFEPLTNRSYLHTSSAFFLDKNMNLNEPFVRAILDFYNAKVFPLDFRNNPVEAQNTVNRWGAKQTGGLIDQFLTYPPAPDTAAIQAASVHFRGAWQTPFIREGTIPGLFKTSENTTVPVNYMRGSFEDIFYAEDKNLGLRLIAMPYSQYDCAMYVILPSATNPLKFNIGHLITQLTSRDLADLVGMAKKRTVNVMFPKLSLTRSLSLASALAEYAAYLSKQEAEETNNKANGTAAPASPNSNLTSTNTAQSITNNVVNPTANVGSSTQQNSPDPQKVTPLNGVEPGTASRSNQVSQSSNGNLSINPRTNSQDPQPGVNDSSQRPLLKSPLILSAAAADSRFRISDIIQQIALEVNESGTEAAAIAGSTVNYSGDVKNFKIDRPFLFFIRQEATNAILFWGTIVNPTA